MKDKNDLLKAYNTIIEKIETLQKFEMDITKRLRHDPVVFEKILPLDTIIMDDDSTVGDYIENTNKDLENMFPKVFLSDSDVEYLKSNEFKEYVTASADKSLSPPEMFLIEKLGSIIQYSTSYVSLIQSKLDTIEQFVDFGHQIRNNKEEK